jgi:hypothetical protein
MDASIVKSARGRRPLKAAQAVRQEIRDRGGNPGNITFLYGAKVDRDWVLKSSQELAACLYLEASQEVSWYSCDTDMIVVQLNGEGYQGSKPDFIFQRYRGQRGLLEAKYSGDIASDPRAMKQQEVQSAYAQACGYTWSWFTDNDAMAKRVLLMNWLSISTVLQELRELNLVSLQDQIAKRVGSEGSALQEIYTQFHSIPRGHVFLALMRGHLQRLYTIDLASRPLCLGTRIEPWRQP